MEEQEKIIERGRRLIKQSPLKKEKLMRSIELIICWFEQFNKKPDMNECGIMSKELHN